MFNAANIMTVVDQAVVDTGATCYSIPPSVAVMDIKPTTYPLIIHLSDGHQLVYAHMQIGSAMATRRGNISIWCTRHGTYIIIINWASMQCRMQPCLWWPQVQSILPREYCLVKRPQIINRIVFFHSNQLRQPVRVVQRQLHQQLTAWTICLPWPSRRQHKISTPKSVLTN